MTVSTVVPGGTLPLLPTCSRQHHLALYMYHTPTCQWFPTYSPDLCYCRTVWCGASSAPPQMWYRVGILPPTFCKLLEWKQLPCISPNTQREDIYSAMNMNIIYHRSHPLPWTVLRWHHHERTRFAVALGFYTISCSSRRTSKATPLPWHPAGQYP